MTREQEIILQSLNDNYGVASWTEDNEGIVHVVLDDGDEIAVPNET